MSTDQRSRIASIVARDEDRILADWLEALKQSVQQRTGRITELELQKQARDFLSALRMAITESMDASSGPFEPVREILSGISQSRAAQGFSPTETAMFVFSLKRALFDAADRAHGSSSETISSDVWAMTLLLDGLGLYTMEVYQTSREDVIARQQREISELSTPVVKLWDGVLALPLIGTLDSQRTQVVMENLLQSLIDNDAEIAIIDITGVPTVDTLVAQHLLKTISAARLMGADCILSGIRPQIAQTMVHLGVELNVVSKASLADAFGLALQRLGRTVVSTKGPSQSKLGGGEPR